MIVFQNDGLIDLRSITTFGLTAKPRTQSPIGHFGTGLKFAIAVILRSAGAITIYRGRKPYAFGVKRGKFRGEDVEIVTMNGQPLPFSLSFGKNWEAWQAYRELHANALDEGGGTRAEPEDPGGEPGKTTIVVDGADFAECYENRRTIFLEGSPLHTQPGLEIHFGESGVLYYKGMKAMQLPARSLFTWNITAPLELTEDRTLKYPFIAEARVMRGILACDNADVVSACLQAEKTSWEARLQYDETDAPVSSTFMTVAAHLKAARAPVVGGAEKLFAERARLHSGYLSHISRPPALAERALLDRARALISSRLCAAWPDIPVLIVDNREAALEFRGRLEVPVGFFDRSDHEIAVDLIVARARATRLGGERWLANVILTGSLQEQEQGNSESMEV